MATVPDEIRKIVAQLPFEYQRRVLEFAEELVHTSSRASALPTTPLPPGTPGRALLHFTLPMEDIEAIERALEDCEKVDSDEY